MLFCCCSEFQKLKKEKKMFSRKWLIYKQNLTKSEKPWKRLGGYSEMRILNIPALLRQTCFFTWFEFYFYQTFCMVIQVTVHVELCN